MSSSSSKPAAQVAYATAADVDCDFAANGSSDKSSGLRKWSRNLSAHRHRELNRLNQIERERQSLELKRQNDLFDQMSVTVKGRTGGGRKQVSELQKEELNSQTGARRIVSAGLALRDQLNTNNQANLDTELVNRNGPTTVVTKPGESESEQANDLGASKAQLPSPTEGADLRSTTELVLTSLASPEDKQAADGEKRLAARAEANAHGPGFGNTSKQVQDRVIAVDSDGINSDKRPTNEKIEEQLTLEQQQFSIKRPITTDQLTRFVSSCVPENKRVLCLIVRDKMSRLNKAKSYFYPTYYLFIQAIVDIEDTGDLSLINTRGSDDDLLGVGENGEIAATSASADNSFSASSSISADMLFIGTNAGGTSSMANVKLSGNSYSDNEVYADTETEDDSKPAQQYPYADSGGNRLPGAEVSASPLTPKQSRSKGGSSITNKAAGSLQGRDSPLVFPNRDINNTARAANCDAGESGSLTGGWPPVLKDSLSNSSDSKKQAIAYPLGQSSRLSGNSKASLKLNISGTGGSSVLSKSMRNQARLRLETAALNIGSQEDLDEDDSDNDEQEQPHCRQNAVDGADDNDDERDSRRQVCQNYKNNDDRIENDEEVDYDARNASGIGRYHCNSQQQQQDLFDDERNPYTGTYGVLLAGRRRKKAKTYLIGPNEYGYTRKNSICKLKSNVLGTQFNAIRLNHSESNDRCTIASIIYETNVLGFKGPRKMRVFLAKDPSKGAKNLPEMFKTNPTAVVQLKNMTPSWNVESQSYVLNFHGRVTQASVKNFQLIECEDHLTEGQRQGQLQLANTFTSNSNRQQTMNKDGPGYNNYDQQQQRDKKSEFQSPVDRLTATDLKEELDDGLLDTRAINSQLLLNNMPTGTDAPGLLAGNKSFTYNSAIVMQFGRISNHEFTCDVTYPLSILQAFAIALSSFDSKLACE